MLQKKISSLFIIFLATFSILFSQKVFAIYDWNDILDYRGTPAYEATDGNIVGGDTGKNVFIVTDNTPDVNGSIITGNGAGVIQLQTRLPNDEPTPIASPPTYHGDDITISNNLRVQQNIDIRYHNSYIQLQEGRVANITSSTTTNNGYNYIHVSHEDSVVDFDINLANAVGPNTLLIENANNDADGTGGIGQHIYLGQGGDTLTIQNFAEMGGHIYGNNANGNIGNNVITLSANNPATDVYLGTKADYLRITGGGIYYHNVVANTNSTQSADINLDTGASILSATLNGTTATSGDSLTVTGGRIGLDFSSGFLVTLTPNEAAITCSGNGTNTISLTDTTGNTTIYGEVRLGRNGDQITVNGANVSFLGYGIVGSDDAATVGGGNTIRVDNTSGIQHIKTGVNGDTVDIRGGNLAAPVGDDTIFSHPDSANSNTFSITGAPQILGDLRVGPAGDTVSINMTGLGTIRDIHNSLNNPTTTKKTTFEIRGGAIRHINLGRLGDKIDVYGGTIQSIIPLATGFSASEITLTGGRVVNNINLAPPGATVNVSGTAQIASIIGATNATAASTINIGPGATLESIQGSSFGDTITVTGGTFSDAVSLSSDGSARTTFNISSGTMNDIYLSPAGDVLAISGDANVRDIIGDMNIPAVTGGNEITVQNNATVRSITTGVGEDVVNIQGGTISGDGGVGTNCITGRDTGKNEFNVSGGVIQGLINLGKDGDEIIITGGDHPNAQIIGSQAVINPAPNTYFRDPNASANTINLRNLFSGTIEKITTSFNGDTVTVTGGTITGDGTNSIVGGYIPGSTITGALANNFDIRGGTIQDNILLGTKGDTITVTRNANVENITGNAETGFGQTYIVGINGGDNSNIVVNDITTSGFGDTVTVYGGTIASLTISQQHATNYQNQINMTGGTVTNLITFQTAGTSVTLSGTVNVAGIVATYDPSGIPLFDPHVYPNVRNTINLSDNAIIGAQGINLQREYFQTSININGGRILGPTIGGYGQDFTDHDNETITAFPEDIVTINGDFSTENIFYSLHTINVGNGTNTPTFTINNNIGRDPIAPNIDSRYKQIQNFTVNQNAVAILNGTVYIRATLFTNNGELRMQNGMSTIEGNFNHTANGTLRFEIEPTTAATGKLFVNYPEDVSQLDLHDGNIVFNVRAGDVTDGRLVEIIETYNQMLGTGISLVNPDGSPANSAFFTFTPQFTGGDTLLSVLVAKKPYTDFVGTSAYDIATANFLNTLEYSGTMNADLENLLTTILRESDPNQVREFIKQITPEYREDLVHDSYYLTMSEVYQMIETRLSHLRLAKHYPTSHSILSLTQNNAQNTYSRFYNFGKTLPTFGVNTNANTNLNASTNTNTFKLISKNKITRKNIFYAKSNSRLDPENFWIQFFGNSTKQKQYDNLPAYTGSAVGFGLGIDANISRFFNIGTSFAYSQTKIKSQTNVGNTLNVTSCQFSLYGMYDPGNYFIEGILSFGLNDYESKRHISAAGISRTAHGKYDGRYHSGKVRSGYNFYKRGFEITPLVAAHHTYLNTDTFSETGATGLNLQSVNYSNITSLMLGAGVRISLHTIHDEELYVPHYLRNEDIFIPHVIVMLEHELNNKKADVAAKFEGSSLTFRNEMRDADRTKLNLGLGFTLYNKSNLSLLASYNFEYRAHGHGHHAYLKFNYKF